MEYKKTGSFLTIGDGPVFIVPTWELYLPAYYRLTSIYTNNRISNVRTFNYRVFLNILSARPAFVEYYLNYKYGLSFKYETDKEDIYWQNAILQARNWIYS